MLAYFLHARSAVVTGNTELSPIPLSGRAFYAFERKTAANFIRFKKNLSLSFSPRRHAREENHDLSANCERRTSRPRMCTFTKFLPVPLGGRRVARTEWERAAEAVRWCILHLARRKRGSAAGGTYPHRRGAGTYVGLMHIGIVANAPGRKKKMNREALPWLAVRAVPAGLLFAGASISRRCNLSSATPLRRFSLVSASAGCVGRGAAKCRTGTFVPRRFVVQRDAPHVSNGRTLRLILVRRNGRD